MVKTALTEAGIRFGYVDVMESLAHLQKLITLRDANLGAFRHAMEHGHIGIPAVVVDDVVLYVGANEIDLEKLS